MAMTLTSHVQITVKQNKSDSNKDNIDDNIDDMRHCTTTTTQMMIMFSDGNDNLCDKESRNKIGSEIHIMLIKEFDFLPICKSKLLIKKSHMTSHITCYNVPSKAKQYGRSLNATHL